MPPWRLALGVIGTCCAPLDGGQHQGTCELMAETAVMEQKVLAELAVQLAERSELTLLLLEVAQVVVVVVVVVVVDAVLALG